MTSAADSTRPRRRPFLRGRLLAVALAAALAGSLGSSPVAAADPPPNAAAKPFRIDLYREGDFVSQTNLVQCVGASMQMMINMMAPTDNRSADRQLDLQNLARKWSPRFRGGGTESGPPRQRRGASSRGWAFGLTRLGHGPYRVTTEASLADAITTAAVAMRRTGRPVGLLVWHGAHAWVMSGFEATGDVLTDPAARVTHVFVLDPLYPRTSSTWGRSPAPDTRLSLKQLSSDYVPWRPGRSNAMSGRFVLVEPLVDLRPLQARFNNLD